MQQFCPAPGRRTPVPGTVPVRGSSETFEMLRGSLGSSGLLLPDDAVAWGSCTTQLTQQGHKARQRGECLDGLNTNAGGVPPARHRTLGGSRISRTTMVEKV